MVNNKILHFNAVAPAWPREALIEDVHFVMSRLAKHAHAWVEPGLSPT
jgi:hypothetical protein